MGVKKGAFGAALLMGAAGAILSNCLLSLTLYSIYKQMVLANNANK